MTRDGLTSVGAGECVSPKQSHGPVDVLVIQAGIGSPQELVYILLVSFPQLLILQ